MGNGLDDVAVQRLLWSLVLGSYAGVLSYKFKFLTTSGSFSAALLAVVLYTCGGWQWLFPMMVFFLPSSVLSHIRKRINPRMDSVFEKGETRDAVQVLVNGGIGGVLVVFSLFHQNPILYSMYLASLSAAIADTWGTEIGVMNNGKTWQFGSRRTVPAGTSGGISLAGTLGGVCGAAVIAFSGISWLSGNVFLHTAIIVFSGVIGSAVDSLMGAILQAQYQCVHCGNITERSTHCGVNGKLIKGKALVTNDIVNAVCNVAGAVSAYALI